jgi:hypothetical protein
MTRIFLSRAVLAAAVALITNQAAAQSPDAVRAALLAPVRGWTMIWASAQAPGVGGATVFFEQRGDRLVAQIDNHMTSTNCEREVTVTAEGARFDLCRETGLDLRHQPQDAEIPFRGRTALRWYIFAPR